MNQHDPEAWFILRSRIEQAWERQGDPTVEATADNRGTQLIAVAIGGIWLDNNELDLLREELVRLKAVLDKAIDISQGVMPDQHRRDLQSLLVALGYLEPRVVAKAPKPMLESSPH